MQRRRLLSAFSEVIAREGLEGTSVGLVCKRAGVSRRTFYELFDDREESFVAVVEDAVERLSQRVLAAYARPARWHVRVRGALSVLLDCFEEEPALARVCLVETLKGGSEILRLRQKTLDGLAGAIEKGASEARNGPGSSAMLAQGIVGGVASVVYARIIEKDEASFVDLLNPLVSMIVLPYLGPAAARRELNRAPTKSRHTPNDRGPHRLQDPFKDIPIRLTFRTARVLATIDAHPGASNRQIGDGACVPDQGQMSKLLRRLAGYGLIENHGEGQAKGEPNAWLLTERGHGILRAVKAPEARSASS